MSLSLPSDVEALIDAAADKYRVSRPLARGVAWIESRGNQAARSGAGAIGIMQLMPHTAAALQIDPSDAAQNVDGGVRYLAYLIERFGEDRALAAYNWGPTRVAAGHSLPESVAQYVKAVQERADLELHRMSGAWDRTSEFPVPSSSAVPLVPAPESPAQSSAPQPLPSPSPSEKPGGDKP